MAPGILLDDRPTLHEQFKSLEGADEVGALPYVRAEKLKAGLTGGPSASAATAPLSTAQQPRQPDIDWVPNWNKYQRRASERLRQGGLETELPAGFPSSVSYAACWTGEDMSETDYMHRLSGKDIEEVEAALSHFKSLKLSMDQITSETFPLPTLGHTLQAVAGQVHQGRGLAVLRGLDPDKYSKSDNVMIYAGVACYVGEKRGVQDMSGNVLVHIKDVGAKIAPDDQRQSPYANNAQPFHNDLGDIIAMYVMDRASSGGESKLASTAHVYNTIATERPDLIHILAKDDWAFDKHTEEPSYYVRPVLFRDAPNDRVFFCFSRRQLTGSAVSPRPASLPTLSEGQAEALDAVHFAAARSALSIRLEKGDMQFVNNLALFHAREAFTDKEGDGSHSRHLIRMWLRNEGLAWTTPKGLQEVWQEIYGDASKARAQWYLEANHPRAHVINRRTSCHG